MPHRPNWSVFRPVNTGSLAGATRHTHVDRLYPPCVSLVYLNEPNHLCGWRPSQGLWKVPTFPPSTSSPMIKHAAVWIVRALRSAGVTMLAKVKRREAAAGAERCLDIWDRRENIYGWDEGRGGKGWKWERRRRKVEVSKIEEAENCRDNSVGDPVGKTSKESGLMAL